MASRKKITASPWGVTAAIGLAVVALAWATWPGGSMFTAPGVPSGTPTVEAPADRPAGPPAQAAGADQAIATTAPATLPASLSVAIPAKDVLTVAVWNGSGIAGAAGQVAQIFRSAGYANVRASNADRYDYVGTTIRYRPGLRGAAEDLGRLLREHTTQFRYDELATGTPPADVVVIVGK